MPLRNHISRIFVDHPQDPVLALTMMVETLAHMAEKNAWFAPLWMQEIIGEMPILRRDMDARFGEERFQVMLGTASLAAGRQDQSGAGSGAAVYHGN